MKFTISCASGSAAKTQPCPCEGAVFNPQSEEWEIEIATLEDLLALIKSEGDLIIDQRRITIYDDYVE